MLCFNRIAAFTLVLATLQLCVYHEWSVSGADSGKHAKLEQIGDSGLGRITLTPKAAERLDIQTSKVTKKNVSSKNGEEQRTVLPYSALIYTPSGETWVYTSPKSLVYIRTPIKVDHINGQNVVLLEGPAIGTDVVTVGVAELYGIETGIGK